MFEKDTQISLLLDFYGDILTDKRRNLMELYYNEDYSLSEISEECGLSRQGVRDSIKKGETQLHELEDKLGMVKRFTEVKSEVAKDTAEIRRIAADTDNEDVRRTLIACADRLDALSL